MSARGRGWPRDPEAGSGQVTDLLPPGVGALPAPPTWSRVLTVTSALPSDLSLDSSDLVMLKSLLAGLSLPSRDGRADHGLDEEGEGECAQGSGAAIGLATPAAAALDRLRCPWAAAPVGHVQAALRGAVARVTP